MGSCKDENWNRYYLIRVRVNTEAFKFADNTKLFSIGGPLNQTAWSSNDSLQIG